MATLRSSFEARNMASGVSAGSRFNACQAMSRRAGSVRAEITSQTSRANRSRGGAASGP